ncbi:putative glutamine-serine-proline rich protein [Aspergillus clavatus NRRL 1]|uniref:Glutamine-serine-proline rich protein, putative n=1 Tax=Aspergillus clavatus (strain ATCC 1007 / CBS 513.65 / DSM 816 / NCTC 3887 / NRRL 1 / QM 1276 / 107) TaxID=344612 RepID=A1CDH3_ASPCL|nr:glutamine-serine-proline rich protein, putative [Aspergillus clavatus NRRL 1]EAW11900.1 glutamine-serine-proline rich protein, putative [Aspergillus clavatus NRRL 1]
MAAQEYYNSNYTGGNKPESPYEGGYGGNGGNNGNRPWIPSSSNPTPGPDRPYSQPGDNNNYTYGSQPPQSSSYDRPHYPQQSWGGNAPGFTSQSRPQQSNNEYGYSERPPYSQNQYDSNQSQPPYPTNDTYPQQSLGQAPYPQGQQDERGLLGALGGGAAGAYAGHQAGHGILGTIGGALSGSVAEDAIKKHRKEKKEKKDKEDKHEHKWGHHHRPSSSSSSSSDDDRDHHKQRYSAQGNLRGNFSASSNEINLEHNYELVAKCRAVSGQHHRSVLPLNSVLSNRNGSFVWARGGNFSASARHVHLADGGRVLEAELADGRGGWKRAWVRLDERITNQNGHLKFLE